MRRYFGRKLLIYGLTFFVAATINWMIPRFMPGDPVQSLLSRHQVAPEAVPHLIAYYNALFGLDQPLWQQYLNFWGSLLNGDLGRSVYQSGRPVTEVILAALPYTLGLLIPAILLSWWAGNKFGAIAARRRYLDNAVLPIGYILSAAPYMWLAIMVAWILGSVLRIFPISGGYSYALEPSLTWAFAVDLFAHWVMPFLSLFMVMFGGWAIGMRNMIIYELDADYSRYLDALGAPSGLVRRYAFRNAVLPQVTGLALQLGVIVAGALVTEIVFSYPGLGKLLLAAVQNEDYFLLQGIFLFVIIGTLIANFLVDIAYVLLDPRTRVGMSGGSA
ncbi:MAG: peptide ABC transporter permease [Chloroflexi bacterium RBG_16_72_14]|nr:MAG: peptide ABC transporter permease [Chloroflexi bacterium RBG_16_72_14]